MLMAHDQELTNKLQLMVQRIQYKILQESRILTQNSELRILLCDVLTSRHVSKSGRARLPPSRDWVIRFPIRRRFGGSLTLPLRHV